MDITAIYTSIAHGDGNDACREVEGSREVKLSASKSLAHTVNVLIFVGYNFGSLGENKNYYYPTTIALSQNNFTLYGDILCNK